MTSLGSNTSTNRRYPTIGELVHQVALLAPIRSPDGSGGAAVTYALEAELWADIRTRSGQSHLIADRLAGSLTHSIWIRWRPGLTPDHRFRFDTRTFLIRSVLDHDGRHRFLECSCEEFVT